MMTSTLYLSITLVLLIVISGFFSASETGMMALNRYRLRHLARKKHRTARLVNKMLERPDRLLGVILIGNTFANIMAASVATVLAVHLFGDVGIAISTILMTLAVLIFAEVTPKTMAAIRPQKMAFFAAWPLFLLLKIFYPIVWSANMIANGLLRGFGIHVEKNKAADALSHDELRTVVHEAGSKISDDYQELLLRVLDLNQASINDIMIPRQEIIGIDLDDDWEEILAQLSNSQYTRLVVYRDNFDQIEGMVHLRELFYLLSQEELDKDKLIEVTQAAYYIPENTPLNVQLLKFRQEKRRSGLVVDEYGDLQGLVTLEDVLEEIVGEFTTDTSSQDVHPQADGSFLVDGGATLRELQRTMEWEFAAKDAKTLSGLVIEYLETIPAPHTSVKINGYPMEIIKVQDNMIKTIRVLPPT